MMADGRGGKQTPKKPASVSGPGKFSKRTDGQPKAVPNVGDSPDLEQGDRMKLEAGQAAAKMKGATGASLAGGGRRMSGEPMTGGKLPPWLVNGESNRPEEPLTEGLSIGPGAGPEVLDVSSPAPDEREEVLEQLYLLYGNEQAQEMLTQLRNERAAAKQAQNPIPFGGPLG